MNNFNLQEISNHRTALMGIATLMIIVCHAPASGVKMPIYLTKIFGLGNYGVDIFLFLSGIGCYYSLSKAPELKKYFKKRYLRIGVPYVLIILPFILFYLLIGEYTLLDAFLSFTTLDYWIEHKGAWFIALLLPLYLSSPLLFKVNSGKRTLGILISMIICIIGLCAINTDNMICDNIQFALQRVPSYLIGMAIGKYCKEGYSVKNGKLVCFLLGGVILFCLCHVINKSIFVGWLLVPLEILILIKMINLYPSIYCKLKKIGNISLESYLLNISFNHLLCLFIPSNNNHFIFYGRYLEYSMVVIGGFMIAPIVNRISNRIIKAL